MVAQMVDFSQRLKQLRKDKHLTQAQVAQLVGVTPSMVSSYETDIRLPPSVLRRFGPVGRCVRRHGGLSAVPPGQALPGYLRAERQTGCRDLRHGGTAERKMKK